MAVTGPEAKLCDDQQHRFADAKLKAANDERAKGETRNLACLPPNQASQYADTRIRRTLSIMRAGIRLTLVIAALGVLYWPGVRHYWQVTKDPYFVPYDAAQYIPAFFKYDPKEPVPTTYAKEYYLNAICPLLYKWSTIIGAQFTDVRRFQLGMMYLAYVFFIVVVGRLGWVLRGAALSFTVVAFTLSAWIYIGLGFIGGAPRMYAYPLISLILYSLLRDRPILLAAAVVLGGLLYPMVGVIGGLCLASWMLLTPLSGNGLVSCWRLSRRLAMLALTGLLTLSALVPLISGAKPYGRRVTENDIAAYPESGPDGNYRVYDQLPYKIFGSEWTTYFAGPAYSHGDPIVPWLNVHRNLDSIALLFVLALTGLIVLIVSVHGLKVLAREDRSGSVARLISFFLVCGALHVIAWLAAPYLYIPTRYFMFSLPFIFTLIFPWSLYVLLGQVGRFQASDKLRSMVFLGIIGVYLAAFGGRGNVELSGSTVEDNTSRPVFDAIAKLPKDVVIAGWPVGPLRKLEYVTRRNAFLTGDLHQVLHLAFMQVMRQRMDALFDAYLSTNAEPLYRLRKEFGVTHLLVDTRDFTDPKHTPEYFAPWRARIPPRLAEIKGKEYLLNEALRKKAAVFNENGLVLLDLAKLP
jgi:hypothetical protein